MDITTIRISSKTRRLLEEYKNHPREVLEDVILRALNELESLKEEGKK